MIRVAGYCRVSTDRDDQASSFEAQQRYFREYIRQHPGWELHEIYADEGITGTSTKKRTQFNRMMADAHAGKFRMLLTKEVSRFSRNILDTVGCTRELKALGVGVLFLSDGINTLDPDAELRLSIMGSIAQEESRRTSSRVVWGQTRQMERGVVFGRSLLGYDVKNGVLSVNPEGAELVRLIFRKYAAEQMGTSGIARFLTEQGFRTYRGSTRWTSGAVIKILNNEKYVGDLIQKKTYTPDYLTHEKKPNKGEVPLVTIQNHHEPIISRELWDQTRQRLQANNKHRPEAGGHSNRYVFSGKIRCGECGCSFVGRSKYRKDGTRVRRWSCSSAVRGGTSACGVGKLVRDDDAMQMLKTAVRSLTMDTGAVISSVTGLAVDAIRAEAPAERADPLRLRQEIGRVAQKKELMMDSYFSGEISKSDMQAMNRKYDRRMEELQWQLEASQRRQQDSTDPDSLGDTIRAEVAGILSGEVESEVFWKALPDSLTVFRDRHLELRLKHLPQVFHFQDGTPEKGPQEPA